MIKKAKYPPHHYPFGSIVESRSWKGDYRYGFNGVESTNEISNNGNHYEFKFREYNPRNGKFWSVDPLFKEYPWNSTFAFAENIVIWAKDLEGLEAYRTNDGEELGKVGNSNEVREIKVSNDENSLSRDEQIGNLRDMISKANDANSNVSETAKANLFYTSKPAEDAQSGEGAPQWMGDVNSGVGVFGLANGAKTELIDHTIRSNYKSAQTWSEFNKLRPTQQAWRRTNTLGKTGASYLKHAKGLGYVGAGLTTAYSVTNAYNYFNNGGTDWQVYTKSVLDVTMTGVGFLGPIGFGVSASYFILDASTGGFGGFGQIKP